MKQYVYVMVCKEGFCKIGRSHNPDARRNQLATSRADGDITVAYRCGPFNGASSVELGAHALLKHCRMAGEWFDCPANVAIESVEAFLAGFLDRADASRGDAAASVKELAKLFFDADSVKSFNLSDIQPTFNLALELIRQYKTAAEDLEAELLEAVEVVDAYRGEARHCRFLAERAVDELRKRELPSLRDERCLLESAIQPSLLN